jgi:hypothetical protein
LLVSGSTPRTLRAAEGPINKGIANAFSEHLAYDAEEQQNGAMLAVQEVDKQGGSLGRSAGDGDVDREIWRIDCSLSIEKDTTEKKRGGERWLGSKRDRHLAVLAGRRSFF